MARCTPVFNAKYKHTEEMSGWFIERDNYPKQCLKMTQGEKYKLGRMPTCDIVCNDVRISKRHCEIYIKKDSSKGFIMDFSGNGTYINSKKLNKFGCYELNSGDRIGLAIPSGYTISGLEPENCFSFRILKIHELEKALEIDNDDSIILETPVDKLGPKKHSKSWMKINLRTTSPRNKKRIQPKNVPSTVKAERSEKLKDIALKQKNQKSKTPQKEKKAPFVAKVTRMNRGAFLLQSTNEKNP